MTHDGASELSRHVVQMAWNRYAIRVHVADEAHDGHTLLTDWYLLTAAAGPETGTTDYLHVCSDSPIHTTLGLVTLAFRRLNQLTEDDDD